MNNEKRQKNKVRTVLLLSAVGLYFLEGTLLNPLIIWTASPIIIGYSMVKDAWGSESSKKLSQAYCFITFSLIFSYIYHLAWFFDWGGTQTGGSTSALIFVWFPVWAIIIGFVGYLLGSIGEQGA